MAEGGGNNWSPSYRRSHNRGGSGHYSPMQTTGGGSSGVGGGGANFYSVEQGAVDPSDVHHHSAVGTDQSLWDEFETVACSVTDLYRNPNWNVFQRTASAATQFYKNSVDARRRGLDSGISIGRQLLCKELIHWLQTCSPSNMPFVRRDEVINFALTRASGADPPADLGGSGNSSPMQTSQRQDSPSHHSGQQAGPAEPLEIFQEALSVPPSTRPTGNTGNVGGLTAFFVEECRRHARAKRRRLSPDYFHPNPSADLSPEGTNAAGACWHPRAPKRSRRF